MVLKEIRARIGLGRRCVESMVEYDRERERERESYYCQRKSDMI